MSHINRRRGDTRLRIVRLGAKLFLEDGYSKTTMKRISRELDLSPGNITFYFPTKDHLLAVLVNELFDFQNLTIERITKDGKSSLFAYCLEFVAIAAICAESEVAKDFYTAAYSSPYTLALIRKNDTQKTRAVFGDFCKSFSEADWVAAENIASGIEYGTIMTSGKETDLDRTIEKALDSILYLYSVPEELRTQTVSRVLSLDYGTLGKRILCEFQDYIDQTNKITEI